MQPPNHNPMVKQHQAQSSQAPMAGAQIHRQPQAHHLHSRHPNPAHHHSMPHPQSMQMSPSMAPPQWVGPHSSPAQQSSQPQYHHQPPMHHPHPAHQQQQPQQQRHHLTPAMHHPHPNHQQPPPPQQQQPPQQQPQHHHQQQQHHPQQPQQHPGQPMHHPNHQHQGPQQQRQPSQSAQMQQAQPQRHPQAQPQHTPQQHQQQQHHPHQHHHQQQPQQQQQQQRQPSQPTQMQTQAPPPHQQQQPPHHMLATHPIMIHHYPNIMYPQMGQQFMTPGMPPYDPAAAAAAAAAVATSHPGEPINLNSHVQPPVSINNHHHQNNMPPSQMQAGISPATTGASNVHPANNGPMMDNHLQNRQPPPPMAQPYFPSPYMQPGAHNMILDPYQMNLAPYPGGHPPPNFNMLPQIRVPGDMGPRAPFDPQNPNVSLSGPKPPITVPTPAAAIPANMHTPPRINPPRKSKAIPIINPDTGHALTIEELKGTPVTSTASQASSKDSSEIRISPQETSISDKQSSSSSEVIVITPDDPKPSDRLTSENSARVESPSATAETPKHVPINESSPTVDTTPADGLKVEKVAPEQSAEQDLKTNGSTESPDQVDSSKGEETVSELANQMASVEISKNESTEEISESTKDKEDEHAKTNESEQKEEKVEKPALPDLPYEAGQFSPLNRNGIRKYTLEFCRAIEKLLNIDVSSDNITMNPLHRFDFIPYFRNDSPAQSLPRRPSQQVPAKPRKIIPTTSLQQEVDLKTVENPWKPELEAEKVTDSTEMDTKRLLKVFRGHLNKLTPQKYDSIIEKIADLDLSGPQKLNSVIDLVFDKAVDEPGFCELYAKMCKVIAVKDQNFCFHLVKKCQEEFETSDLYDGLNVDERKVAIENESDMSRKKLMSEELYEDMRQRRKKYLGTIKLIGEMYKFGLLLPKIIGLCMQHLIAGASNENIECLCSLIVTVGSKMAEEQDEKIKTSLKHTLSVLHDLANPKRTTEDILESRIKFKILDTIDLSRRNWRPRMVENNPKKIEELREEAERAAKEEAKQHHHNHSNQSKNASKYNSGKTEHRRHVEGVLAQQRRW